MSTTPETDAFYFPHGLDATAMHVPAVTDSVAFARSLERRLREAEQEYKDCQITLQDERYCHGQTIADLKRIASEEIQAAHQRAERAEAALAKALERAARGQSQSAKIDAAGEDARQNSPRQEQRSSTATASGGQPARVEPLAVSEELAALKRASFTTKAGFLATPYLTVEATILRIDAALKGGSR